MIEIDGRILAADEMEAALVHFTERAALRGGSGERVAARFRDNASSLAFILAARRAGATLLPIHPALPNDGARRLAARAGCHRIFLDDLDGENLDGESLDDAPPPVPGEGHLLQMSSGTTGEPKCIARPWQAVEREIASYVAAFTEPEGMTPVIACPITHSYGLICGLLVGLHRGGRRWCSIPATRATCCAACARPSGRCSIPRRPCCTRSPGCCRRASASMRR